MIKTSNEKLDRFLQLPKTTALVIFSVLSLSGCLGGSSDDVAVDGGGGDGTPVSAFNFTADNTVTAAKLAADTMVFFPAFSEIGHTITSALAISDPNNSPYNLMLCANAGSSILIWNDVDSSGDLSAGDSSSLVFNNCDIDGIANGTVDFTYKTVNIDLLPNSIALTVSVNLSIYDAPDTTTFTANFLADWNTVDNNLFTIVYTAEDTADQKLTIADNGTLLYKFGCFEVTETYSPSTLGTYSLAAAGVINAADNIMSLAGGPALTFSDDTMETGTKRLLSMAVPECASVGVAGGVNDSDGSYLDMEALGGGIVRLHTYDVTNVEFFTQDTTWDALLVD